MKREEGWLWLCSHLHISGGLREAKEKISSAEFVLWMGYREYLLNDFHREDYNFARVCQIIRSLVDKEAQDPRQYLIKFGSDDEEDSVDMEITEEEAAARARGLVNSVVTPTPNRERQRH